MSGKPVPKPYQYDGTNWTRARPMKPRVKKAKAPATDGPDSRHLEHHEIAASKHFAAMGITSEWKATESVFLVHRDNQVHRVQVVWYFPSVDRRFLTAPTDDNGNLPYVLARRCGQSQVERFYLGAEQVEDGVYVVDVNHTETVVRIVSIEGSDDPVSATALIADFHKAHQITDVIRKAALHKFSIDAHHPMRPVHFVLRTREHAKALQSVQDIDGCSPIVWERALHVLLDPTLPTPWELAKQVDPEELLRAIQTLESRRLEEQVAVGQGLVLLREKMPLQSSKFRRPCLAAARKSWKSASIAEFRVFDPLTIRVDSSGKEQFVLLQTP